MPTGPPRLFPPAGVFAFNLYMCVRARLFARTILSIVQYTVLLVLFGTASLKGVGVPFLAATLASEVFSVAFLAGKLQDMAGRAGRERGRPGLCPRLMAPVWFVYLLRMGRQPPGPRQRGVRGHTVSMIHDVSGM